MTQKIPGVNFEDDIDEEKLSSIDESTRNDAINAIKSMNGKIEASSPFKPRQRPALKKTQDDIFNVLEKNGYSSSDGSVMMAVSLLIDNLSRVK